MKGERWLLRLGELLVRAAAARLPRRVRGDRHREWTAELPVILHDPDGGSWPQRAARMLGYALDTIRGTTLGPRPARYRGAHAGEPDFGSLLKFFGVLVLALAVIAALPVFVYFMVTTGNSLVIWTMTWSSTGISLAKYAIRRRRGTHGRWSGAGAWLSAGVMLIATGYVAIFNLKDLHVRGSALHLVTLASYGTDVAGTACIGVSLLVAVRLVTRRRAGVPGEGTAGR